MRKQDKYELVAALLSRFEQNRWLLSKFLVDNEAINESFLKKINTDCLSDEPPVFRDLTELNDYLNKLINRELSLIHI